MDVVTIAEELKLIFTGVIPSVNHYYGYHSIGKGIISKYVTADGKKFKHNNIKYIEQETKKQQWRKLENQLVYFDSIFYFPATGKNDCDNRFKVLLDSVTESNVVWDDDKNVMVRVFNKYVDSKNPRVEVVIHKADQIGIFNNQNELQEFINTNCVNCTNYKNNSCSRLTKALEGRIINEEYNIKECLKKRIKKSK